MSISSVSDMCISYAVLITNFRQYWANHFIYQTLVSHKTKNGHALHPKQQSVEILY